MSDPSRIGRLSEAKRALLEQRLRERAAAHDEAVAAAPELSFAQERLWLLSELTPGLVAYNTARVVRLDGRVDITRLTAGLRAVVARHDVLRTHVRADAHGTPRAEVGAVGPPQLEVLDADGDEAHTWTAVAQFAARPFDLAHDDLLRALLVHCPDGTDLLALSLHHIASDEGSRAVLWRDLAAAYAGSELAPLPMQYAAYARAQRRELERPAQREHLEWWRRYLDGAPQIIELPTDHVRPAQQSYRGARHRVRLEPDLAATLRSFGAGQGATLFMTVLAAFGWVLRSWARTEDIPIGMLVSGRDRPETDRLIGMLVNTLVLRADCSGDPDFAELVGRARGDVLAALEHQEVPFEKIVEAVAPARDLSRNPLFQVAVNAITAEQAREFRFGELTARAEDFDPLTTKFDLALLVAERDTTDVELVVEYASDLFDAATVADLADELHQLLRAAMVDPTRPLATLDLLPDDQRQRLVHDVNATDAPIPDGCLHELIAAQAARTPDAPAVADESTSLTYRELDERTNALAHHLVSLGVDRDVPVAVAVRRSVAMEIAVLAVLKAGGAYVPLDSEYPADRLAYMVDDCGAQVLITEATLLATLPPARHTVLVDDLDAVVAGQPSTPPPVAHDAAQLAYVIYTSGSTGRPKGVQLEHRGVVNRLQWMQRAFALTGDDTVLQKTPLSFDVSVWEVLWPLLFGARLFLARPDGHRDARYLHDVIARERVSVLHFVPSMLAAFLDGTVVPQPGSTLRAVMCSGEALPFATKERFFELLPNAELHNLYGPTEASIDVTWAQCRPGPAHPVLIGAPIDNVQVYVVDEQGRPQPTGVPGELLLAGVQLARGYVGRPDLTAERFVASGLAPGGRAYRTGDLVRWTSGGQLDYLGRIDRQVKLRGFRVELGEIESVLAESPDVARCHVVLTPAPSGELVLAAYVLLRAGLEAGPVTDEVAAWQSVWQQTYAGPGGDDPFFDISGWASSYTGRPIPADEMREWVETTVERIAALEGRSVLEIGSGTGLLLWRLAAGVERYVATDFSAEVAARLRRLAATTAAVATVDVRSLPADAVDAASVGDGFDVVIANSVVQYFPSGAYLLDVLHRAVSVLAPAGRVFVGDVRDLRRQAAFALHTENAHREARSPGELRLRVEDRCALDRELLVDPALFDAVAGVGHVQAMPKRGAAVNEMTAFRFDVVLHTGAVVLQDVERWTAWTDVDALEALLRGGGSVGVQGIPDLRAAADLSAAAALGLGAAPSGTPIDLEQLWQLAERYGYHLELSVLATGSGVDAAFTHDDAPVRFPSGAAPDRLTNDPAAAADLASVRARVVADLAEAARSRLPAYMAPTSVQVLPRLPVTANGKLDLAGLPAPIESRAGGGRGRAPQTPTEQELARLWTELLGVAEIGVGDDFFRLGGHSLLAVRLVSAIARSFDVTLDLRAVFETPTVGALARAVEQARESATGSGLRPVERSTRRVATRSGVEDATAFPLSWAQERMWFLEQLEGGRPVYTVRRVYRVHGGLDVDVLQRALDALAARHDSLRTVLASDDGTPTALVLDAARWPVSVHPPADEPAARAAIAGEALVPFALEDGPLATAAYHPLSGGGALLVLRLHHLVVDGWSLDVLIGELAELYGAGGDAGGLDAPPLQYPDFAVWQRHTLDDAALAGQLDHWRTQLAGAPPVLDLPTDRPRRPTETSPGRRCTRELGRQLAEGVRFVARDRGATPFAVLHAACAWVLGTLAAQEDVVVGTAVAGRARPEVARSVGLFANTLVLRLDLSDAASFAELVDRSAAALRSAQANQDIPFERLVEELRPQRELGRNPLFQVMINMQPADQAGVRLGSAALSPYDVEAAYARFDLSFVFAEVGDDLRLTVEYDADLFDDATGAAVLERVRAVLAAAVAAPSIAPADLPVLTQAERDRVLRDGSHFGPPPSRTTVELIEKSVRARPDAVAVRGTGHEPLTYAGLWGRSSALAEEIAARTERGALVGIAVSRTPDLVVAALATWRAGCAFVPLDLAYPADRLAYMRDDAGVALVLGDDEVRRVDVGVGGPRPPTTDAGRVELDDLAYVIYTSGSTGRPKGVAIEHRALANLLTSMAHAPGATADDVLIAVTTFSFDIAGLELFLPLITGGTVVVADRDTVADPGALGRLLTAEHATIMQATPSTYRMLLDAGWSGAPIRALCGGEALPADVAGRLLPRVSELWNCYGPTETTIWSTVERIVDASDITVGRPIDNTAAYVLDHHRRLVPPGTRGELWLGGAGVARGYLHRPDLTAERFVPDPFRPGELMYRTGDIAAWTPDGRLRSFGRTDNQVKLRGHRIELGEIETVLQSLPGVREAVVVVRDDVLIAYHVGACPDLLDRLGAVLPRYMVPSVTVELDEIPRTANGKTDRAALPAPRRTAATGRAPVTPAEQAVAAVWSELLDVAAPTVDDDFFASGGHSLLATRLAARLAGALDRPVELRVIFEHPTLGGFAAALADDAPFAPLSAPRAIARAGRALTAAELDDRETVLDALAGKAMSVGDLLVFPMSSTQQRMWLLHQMAPDDPGYHVPILRELRTPLDLDTLRRSLRALIDQHEVLRTTYRQLDDLLVQIVHPAFEIDVEVHDVEDARATARELAARPFDLEGGPVLRTHLLRADDDRTFLLLCAHHIALDGWSIDQILGALTEEAAPPALQYGDYAVWEHESAELAADRAYWHAALADAPPESGFPLTHPRSVEAVPVGRRIRTNLGPDLRAELDAYAAQHRTTPFMVLCAAVSALLSRHGAGNDVVLGTPFATRTFPGGESMVGPLINTLPLRLRVEPTHTFGRHLQEVATACTDAYRHGRYPFDKLVTELVVDRDPARHPIFQVLVDSQGGRPSRVGAAHAVDIDWGVTRYETALALSGDELVLQYRADLLDNRVAAWLAERLLVLLRAGLRDDDTPLHRLPVCGADEVAVLDELAHMRSGATAPTALPDRIARVAGGRSAVAVGRDELTFAELRARADGIAGVLHARGVGRGDRVAVVLGHSVHWPVAALGVWRAGAAFVPVDPSYPAARRDFMLSDSGAVAVLTDRANAGAAGPGAEILDGPPAPGGSAPVVDTRLDDLAYVIYTSGSTGTPKGTLVEHGALAALTDALHSAIHAGDELADARVSVNAPISFDASVQQLLHLGLGATLLPIPEPVRLDPAAFVDYVREQRITLLDATPTHLRQLVAAGLLDAPTLETILVGGEPLDQALWRQLAAARPATWNMYGPTEVTVDTVVARVAGDGPPVIGRPLPGVDVRIVDTYGTQVPVGVTGELWLAGPQLARGYLDRPELTAARFADGWYRSGDLVRLRPDGAIEYVGRNDDQVKVHGYRIELGEAAAALRQAGGVADAAAGVRDGELVGYVVPEDPHTFDATAVRHELRDRLPAHLVPAVLVPVAGLPLLPNGKLDLRALAAQELDVAVRDVEPPEGPAEELIAELWAELLGVESVGAYDDFFDLGGNSLSASRFIAQLRAMDIDLPLMTVFTHPTVRRLADPITHALLRDLAHDE